MTYRAGEKLFSWIINLTTNRPNKRNPNLMVPEPLGALLMGNWTNPSPVKFISWENLFYFFRKGRERGFKTIRFGFFGLDYPRKHFSYDRLYRFSYVACYQGGLCPPNFRYQYFRLGWADVGLLHIALNQHFLNLLILIKWFQNCNGGTALKLRTPLLASKGRGLGIMKRFFGVGFLCVVHSSWLCPSYL